MTFIDTLAPGLLIGTVEGFLGHITSEVADTPTGPTVTVEYVEKHQHFVSADSRSYPVSDLIPPNVLDIINYHAPITIKGIIELSHKSETTVRKSVKDLVDSYVVELVPESKPARFRMAIPESVYAEAELDITPSTELAIPDADTSQALVIYGTNHDIIDVITDEDEIIDAEVVEDDTDLDALVAAIAATPIKKTRKVATTQVDKELNRLVKFSGEVMTVTAAFPLAVDAPPLDTVDNAYVIASQADHRPTFDAELLTVGPDKMIEMLEQGWTEPTDITPATAAQIAAIYFVTVQEQLNSLYLADQITYPVWYGRSCRLQHLVIGHGRGTGNRKPEKIDTDN